MWSRRDGAAKADGLIRGFAAGIQHLHRLRSGNMLADQLGKTAFHFRCSGAEEAGMITQRLDDSLRHVWIVVAEKMRGECGVVVEVFIAVDIPDPGPFSACKGYLRRDGSVNRDHAPGDVFFVVRQNFFRFFVFRIFSPILVVTRAYC